MSDRKKLGPVRQFSLQTEIRRPILKKQLSVEHLNSIEEHKIPIRTESAKTNKLSDRPRPIKVAWAENRQSSKEEPLTPKSRICDPVEVKKCKEFKRPVTAKLQPQLSIEKESILYSREELAERLRKVWKVRDESKQNLNIFLGRSLEERSYDDEYEDVESVKEEIIKPKQIVDKLKNDTITSEFNYVPSTTASRPQDVRMNISVTIPIVPNKKLQDIQQSDSLHNNKTEEEPELNPEPKLVKQSSLIQKDPDPLTSTLPPRLSKRESFQKRTNTAFSGSLSSSKDFRPPLTRTLSVPVKSDCNKVKFIATKRRSKLARRKGKDNEDVQGDEDEKGEKTTKKGSRCKSAQGGELVTMVSLVSPAGSDTEEHENKEKEDKEKEKNDGKNGSNSLIKPMGLRKNVKSVSFQQSSIHAVRSFSVILPSRRGGILSTSSCGEREKRAPMESSPNVGELRGPKRRLVRAVSIAEDDVRLTNQTPTGVQNDSSPDSRSKSPDNIPEDSNQTLGVTRAEILPAKKKEKVNIFENIKEDEITNAINEEYNDDPSIPKFQSSKERECWVMYKKMTDKGLPISYDTILRGMLTPTEYRSVRKEIKNSS